MQVASNAKKLHEENVCKCLMRASFTAMKIKKGVSIEASIEI